MKKNKIGLVLIIIGISIILYPVVSNIIASHSRSVAISKYQEEVEELTKEEKEARKEEARQYNEKLTEEDTIDVQINDEEVKNRQEEGTSYLNVLNVGEVIGYLDIPKVKVYLPIYHGTSEDVLQSGVGHVENSSFPIGEKGTHAVFAGHTGLVRTKIFDDLDKIQIGDQFYIHILDEKYAYRVDQIKVVEPEDNKYIAIEENKEYVTLLTCTPYGINTHRLLVRGSRVQLEEKQEEYVQVEESGTQIKILRRNNVIMILLIISGIIVLIGVVTFICKK